ncbi:hypothetical protein ACWD4Z_22865 [Streptomyces antibioticus]
MKPLITSGRCTGCGRPAERGRSGCWWHTGGPGCGRPAARFEAEDQDAPERQQQAPRDRQIRTPRRDR